MSGVRLELANPNDYDSPQDYVERHLAPVLTELHRLTSELFAPGSTSEEASVDMVPESGPNSLFQRFDKPLDGAPKHVVFDGSAYFSLPKELLRAKQAKVQLTAVAYCKSDRAKLDECGFRLVSDDGTEITNSSFSVTSPHLETVSKILPFGEQPGSIWPDSRVYYLEGRSFGARTVPVCRRF